MKKYVIILVGLLLLLPVVVRAFPFEEDFENTNCSFDIIPSSGWGVVREHGAWSTFRGERHLDNNIHETYQYKNYNRETVICAKMNRHVKISSYSSAPILSYWYKSNLAADERIYVDIYYIKENLFGRKKERVDRLKAYKEWDNTGEFYIWEKISLKKYRGKETWVMFKQSIGKDGRGGVFVVDDFKIGQLPAQDTDNDMIPDFLDPTPNNEILPPVKNFRAINVGTEEVHLLWSAIEDEPLLAGYRIYRRKDGEIREVMLNNKRLLHPQQTSLIDHDIQNATGYHYRAVAVSKEGHEGEHATPADVFVYVKYDQVLEFPFEESFDSMSPNFIIPQGSGWAIAHDHHGWNSFSGTSHLDTNPFLMEQQKVFGSTNNICAMMKKRVYIPSHITAPFLSYWYTMNLNKRELKYKADSVFWKFLEKIGLLNLLNDIFHSDEIHIDIHYMDPGDYGNKKASIDRSARIFSPSQNTKQYTWESLSLDKYKGTEIWISFRQKLGIDTSNSIFIIDDIRISEPSFFDTNNNGIPDECESGIHAGKLPFVKNLSALSKAPDCVQLSWSALDPQSSSTLAGYNIYRTRVGPESLPNKINELLIVPEVTHWVDTTAEKDTEYFYHIAGVSAENIEGYPGNSVFVFLPSGNALSKNDLDKK